MTRIDAFKINEVMTKAKLIHQKKTFGGISSESANEALQYVADNVKKIAEDVIDAVQKELDSYKGKTAKEMADFTSERDKFIQKVQVEASRADVAEAQVQQVQKKLDSYKGRTSKEIADLISERDKFVQKAQAEATRADAAEAKIKQSKKSKVGKPKVLHNGNIEYKKLNKNGATLVVEKTPNGKLVRVKGEDLDGNLRETTFDPQSGKRIKTFTNVNGDKVYIYDDANVLVKPLNRIRSNKVEMFAEEIIEEKPNSHIMELKRSYSDGSVEYVTYDKEQQIDLSSTKRDKAGVVIEHKEFVTYLNDKMNFTKILKFNPETRKKSEMFIEYADGRTSKLSYTPNGNPYKLVERTSEGLLRTITAKVDKYGNVNHSDAKLEYIYPKSSKIKSSKINLEDTFSSKEEVLTMRDGSVVTLKIDESYKPFKLVIESKKDAEKVSVTDRQEIYEYLKSIGKVGYLDDRKYYSNCIREL